MSERAKILVLGAGAWGTALAQLMAANGHDTTLWAHEAETADAINQARENTPFLPGIELHSDLRAVSGHPDFQVDLCLVVIPAQFMRASLERFVDDIPDRLPMVLCSKGIETQSLSLMTDVLSQTVPQAQAFVLSGPSFAADVARGLPTAVTFAGATLEAADRFAPLIAAPHFRPYTANDLVGAEVGGAVKNVLAIACGMCLGMELGQSAHAALIARGFAEMRRLGAAMGAQPETLSGLCGLGDLVLTCSSRQSRNMSCGYALGQGETIEAVLGGRRAVTEGVATAPALVKLSEKFDVDLPICRAVAAVLSGALSPQKAMAALLERPLKEEADS